MRKTAPLLLALLLSGTLWAQSPTDSLGLKDTYASYFPVGVATGWHVLRHANSQRLIRQNFSSLTCENAMKPASVHPRPGVWNWAEADSIANFCRRHGIRMRGHNLCWHNQFCDWMLRDANGQPVSKELFYQRLRQHIHTVVNRYKDVVYAWDVVNEAMSDGGPDPYRQSALYKLCGDEFIAKAFQYAHEADPHAILIYNDYSACDPRKCRNICHMVRKMQQAGVPITGIGMQAHYNIHWPDTTLVEQAIQAYAQLVPHIHITEMDVRAGNDSGGQLQFQKGQSPLTPEQEAQQQQQYTRLFRIFRRHSDVIDSVTFWNLTDRDSWLGAKNYPLLFDAQGTPKPAYYQVRDFR